MPADHSFIELDQVTKSYRAGQVDVPVLRGVTLHIDQGEYVAIVGRSGSGKSTLMNILGCLDTPTEGSYHLAGRSVAGLDDDALSELRGKTIGFVFQSFHLLRGMTILENVDLPMEYQKTPAARGHRRARRLLERVGLGHRLRHRPNQLSGGERQRVAIARALVNEPALLLADEPTGNLDSRAQQNILQLFDDVQRETNITLVVVTHDPGVARLARRTIRISDGRMEEEGQDGPS